MWYCAEEVGHVHMHAAFYQQHSPISVYNRMQCKNLHLWD